MAWVKSDPSCQIKWWACIRGKKIVFFYIFFFFEQNTRMHHEISLIRLILMSDSETHLLFSYWKVHDVVQTDLKRTSLAVQTRQVLVWASRRSRVWTQNKKRVLLYSSSMFTMNLTSPALCSYKFLTTFILPFRRFRVIYLLCSHWHCVLLSTRDSYFGGTDFKCRLGGSVSSLGLFVVSLSPSRLVLVWHFTLNHDRFITNPLFIYHSTFYHCTVWADKYVVK
jgi:hypothetical protein